MRDIFSKCEYAFSWLGESDSTSDLAMDSIARLETFVYLHSQEPQPHHEVLTQGNSHFCQSAPWIAIRKLLEREFWHRVWIFQEIVLPKKLVLVCGSKSLSWTAFTALSDLRIDIRYWHGDYKLLRKELAHLDVGTGDEVITVCRMAQRLYKTIESRHFPGQFHDIHDKFHDIRSNIFDTTHLKATDGRDKVR